MLRCLRKPRRVSMDGINLGHSAAKSNHMTLVHANSRGVSPTGVPTDLTVPILYVIGGMTDRSNRDPQRSSMSGVVMPLPERARTVARALSSHVQDWAARRGAICI